MMAATLTGIVLACALLTSNADDATTLARQILDDSLPARDREALIQKHLNLAHELVAEMTTDLGADDSTEEYRRIPWIWRVAISVGKRGEPQGLKRLLEVSLPASGGKLRDWQAVVIGGGLINGISQAGQWPQQRIGELIKGDEDLSKRWRQTLADAAEMADSDKVPTGTRYDALRIIALDPAAERREQLAKYLAKGTNAELQMGAVSGLSDIDAPPVASLLLDHLDHLAAGNRKLALDALLRSDERAAALLMAIEKKKVTSESLSSEQVKTLRSLTDSALRDRARQLVPERPSP